MKTKNAILLCMIVFMPRSFFEMRSGLVAISPVVVENSPDIQKPEMILRKEWDNNLELLSQYQKQVGTPVSFKILGKTRTRVVRESSYLTLERIDSSELKKVYSKIFIHHTELPAVGDATTQARFIRDGQILDKKLFFSDIAYHFLIASDGKIVECRPMTHMGTHAGKTLEAKEYRQSDFTRSCRMDPDYGSIGIVLVGDFDKHEPSQTQLESLIALLDWLKWEYEISDEGVLYHEESVDLMLASGLTPLSRKKTCPGIYFPSKEWLLARVIEDTEPSCFKEVLLKT